MKKLIQRPRQRLLAQARVQITLAPGQEREFQYPSDGREPERT